MLEGLRRKTLQWEKINPRGRLINRMYAYDDGKIADHLSTLALRGNMSFKGLGYCDKCLKIMTRRDYEKHLHPTAGAQCLDCLHHSVGDCKVAKDKDGKLSIQYEMLCGYSCEYKEVTTHTPCEYYTCKGNFIKLTDNIVNSYNLPIIPKKIVTIKAFENWNITKINEDSFIELYDPSGDIAVRVDKNGYVTRFVYNGFYCYYDDELEEFISLSDGKPVGTRERHKAIMREVFKNEN